MRRKHGRMMGREACAGWKGRTWVGQVELWLQCMGGMCCPRMDLLSFFVLGIQDARRRSGYRTRQCGAR